MDDHELFAQSLAIALEGYEEIQGFYTTRDLTSLTGLIVKKKIDLVLMDIHVGTLTVQDGLAVASRLNKEFTSLKIVILTG